jgi:hypothetical protein
MDTRSFQEQAKVRDAILRAADQIEAHPESLDFANIIVPQCGSPGCALGWIGVFAQITGFVSTVSEEVLGLEDFQFYSRMVLLQDQTFWGRDATECARCLRLYADKYHPASTLDPSFAKYRDGLVREFAMDSREAL